jgi:nitrous oxide reductase
MFMSMRRRVTGAAAMFATAAVVVVGGPASASSAVVGSQTRTHVATSSAINDAHPNKIVPGTCDPAGSGVSFFSELFGGEVFCFSGHGDITRQIADVTVFEAGAQANGWFQTGPNCEFITTFIANDTIKWTLGVRICGLHLD